MPSKHVSAPSLPIPDKGQSDLLVIAGEHSGDQHAARLIKGLLEVRPEFNVVALGGGRLENAGAQLLYDLTRHSVVGFFEVLKSYSFFRDSFHRIVGWISEHRPRNICLVDFPGFNLRLAKKLYEVGLSRKGGGEIGVYYYIGPQIWAWKAKRRFQMARYLDALAVIFPFEVDCYKDTALPVSFVGHPFVDSDYCLPLRFDAEGPVLLLPGSRRTAVSRIFPLLADAFESLLRDRADESALIIYPDSEVRDVVEAILRNRDGLRDHCQLAQFEGTFSGKAVLTSSGTMSLACGLAGIPGAIAYRAHPLTYLLARTMIRIPYLGIANLLLEEPLYPEFIQGRANRENLVNALEAAISSQEKVTAACEGSRKLRAILSREKTDSASAWLEKLMSCD